MEQAIKEKPGSITMHHSIIHTTIALQKETKERLDNNRAPGQCYDGFINELVEYWERYRIGSSLCGPGRPVVHDREVQE
jgi:hypothetical protein